MRISSLEEYGTRCALQLALMSDKGSVSAAKIAEKEGISPEYARKILFLFRTTGLVEAQRGKQGGFFLKKDPADITLKMIFDALGEFSQKYGHSCEEYFEKDRVCLHNEDCSLRPVWSLVSQHVDKILNAITLKDLMSTELKAQNMINKIETHNHLNV